VTNVELRFLSDVLRRVARSARRVRRGLAGNFASAYSIRTIMIGYVALKHACVLMRVAYLDSRYNKVSCWRGWECPIGSAPALPLRYEPTPRPASCSKLIASSRQSAFGFLRRNFCCAIGMARRWILRGEPCEGSLKNEIDPDARVALKKHRSCREIVAFWRRRVSASLSEGELLSFQQF